MLTKLKTIFLRLIRNNIFRLNLLYMFLFIVTSIVTLAFFYKALGESIDQSIEQEVNSEITRHLGTFQSSQLGIKPNDYAFFIEQGGKKIAGNINQLPEPNTEFSLIEVDAKKITKNTSLETKGDIIGKTVPFYGNSKIFIGKNSNDAKKQQKKIIKHLSKYFFFLLITVVIGGFVISYKAMKRIDRISMVSKKIMAGDIGLRIPTTSYNDDIEGLARNLNQMLDKTDNLMSAMRQVSSNVAHDLRTPLTRLRTNIESIEKKSKGLIKKQAENALIEVDGILLTFTSLLRISQIESGSLADDFVKVNLSEIAYDVIEFCEVLVLEKEHNLKYDLNPNIEVMGNRELLSQALINLVTNSIKYCPNGSNILISVKLNKTNITLSVQDNGKGVKTKNIAKLTDRFFRLEKHRGKDNGSGLGLSLVKAIAESHSAKLSFESKDGFLAVITFPLS